MAMYQLLFKNRFNALVFVAITLFSVRILIGTPDEQGAIESAAANFGSEEAAPQPSGPFYQASAPATQQTAVPAPVQDDVVVEFTPDEDLIDDAAGYDPSDLAFDD